MASMETFEDGVGVSHFERLMPFRIRDILLVSSLYDSFILEQDGHLTEMLMTEYAELNLSYAPVITRVSSGEEALDRLVERPFDLVITMTRLGDMEVSVFGEAAKEIRPDIPVVLLVYSTRELITPTEGKIDIPGIDLVFAWRGDVRILLGIIKCIEDRINAGPDAETANVRTLMLIEDSVRFYSSYLPMLYTEFMRQTQGLMVEGIDIRDRLLRMRARPKIILAQTFEEAEELYATFRNTMLGVITDAEFAREGEKDPAAGVEFARRVREQDPDLPILLQSSNEGRAREAHALGINFLHKHSPTLLGDLRHFMKTHLGFGRFIFTLPDGTEVARADDLMSMARQLVRVPPESLRFHALRNHFSNWFMARTEFALAQRLRPVKVSEFDDMEVMRQYLLDTLGEYREAVTSGRISDFRRGYYDASSNFMRIGTGSLGGKGRGLAFINSLFSRSDFKESIPDVKVYVPQSAVIGTDIFDQYMEDNDLFGVALSDQSDEAIAAAFLRARLPEQAFSDLRSFLSNVGYPLAVRSSSLLEDSQHQPFAGVYVSHMLPNNHPDDSLRLKQLLHAIKLVYASTYFSAAKAYISSTPNRIEEEKMAVILQRVVGRRHGDVLYPCIGGVGQSHNYYPVHGIEPEDGATSVVLGLGKAVVEGERSLWFSPKHPRILPQFPTTKDFLEHAQREFWMLDLSAPEAFAQIDGAGSLIKDGLARAERDGTLWPLGSTYMPDNDAVYDGISREGVRLVTFAHILKSDWFPLSDILEKVLSLGCRGMAAPVEIEFAANPDREGEYKPEFALLQIRPLVVGREEMRVDRDELDTERLLIYSEHALGNGRLDGIHDIVLVREDVFQREKTPEIALAVRNLNRKLADEGKPYLLVGPGRWGTRDRWLGIPVAWTDITWARAVVETELEGIKVKPSQGSHFFHNMISNEVAYFSALEGERESYMKLDLLADAPVVEETELLRHIRLDKPLDVFLDGHHGRGAVLLSKE
ncbi:histidine kinase [bacterium]|nr:histidine kinase [bacterium]